MASFIAGPGPVRNRRAAASASAASPSSAASRSAADGACSRRLVSVAASCSSTASRRLAGGQLAPRLGEQRVARGLGLAAQLADRGRGVPHLEARHERVDVGVDDAPRRGGLGLARLHVLVHDLPQVVDRVEVDVLERADRGVDVARHGEVEHEHRPVAALLERAPHVVEPDHEAGARGRGDDDVGLRQVRGERVEADHRGGQAFGDALGAARAAVRDDQAADPLRVQVARGELDHLAGADQERGVPLEAREHAPREPDAGRGDRDRARADRGLGAHALGDRERGLEQPVELRCRPCPPAARRGRRP